MYHAAWAWCYADVQALRALRIVRYIGGARGISSGFRPTNKIPNRIKLLSNDERHFCICQPADHVG